MPIARLTASLRVLFLLPLALVLTGCLQSTVLVRVKPDGSGTLEQTMLVNIAAVKGMFAGMGGQTTQTSGGGTLNEAEFKRSAERMGVKPISLTPVKNGPFEGATALFGFDDVSKIRVDQSPQLSGSTSGSFASAPTSDSPIRFALARNGATSVLTISVDEKATQSATSQIGSAPKLEDVDPAMMQMVKTMFAGMRILIDVEVEGKIVKTTADYVTGSRVTLLELDANGLFAEEAKLKALQSKLGPDLSISQLRPYLKDIKGVKVNRPTVTLEYR